MNDAKGSLRSASRFALRTSLRFVLRASRFDFIFREKIENRQKIEQMNAKRALFNVYKCSCW